MKLGSIYVDYFSKYSNYFEIFLILLKSMYVMTKSRNLFAYDLTEWILDAGFIQYKFQISIYYNYAPDGAKIVVLSHIDDCVYWYTSKAIGKLFV